MASPIKKNQNATGGRVASSAFQSKIDLSGDTPLLDQIEGYVTAKAFRSITLPISFIFGSQRARSGRLDAHFGCSFVVTKTLIVVLGGLSLTSSALCLTLLADRSNVVIFACRYASKIGIGMMCRWQTQQPQPHKCAHWPRPVHPPTRAPDLVDLKRPL
jgi:hypothetical protein